MYFGYFMLNLRRNYSWSLFKHSFLLYFIFTITSLQKGALATDLSKKINEEVISTPILISGYLLTRGVNDEKESVLRGRLGDNITLPCKISKSHLEDTLSWWYRSSNTRNGQLIGSLTPITRVINTNWSRDGVYELHKNGDLLLINVGRELVAR